MLNLIFMAVGYLLGSLSSAIILSRIMKFDDPRTQGSGNAGATNVLRTAGKKQALYVALGDVLKGLIAILLARLFGVSGLALGLVALAAVVGHIFPLYFGFKGGKGVATALGVMLGLAFFTGIVLLILWAAIAYLSGYASLASMVAVVAAVIFMLIFGHSAYAFPVFVIAVLVIWKHAANIERLRKGAEEKINW